MTQQIVALYDLEIVPAPASTVPAVSADQAVASFQAGWSRWQSCGPLEAELVVGNSRVVLNQSGPYAMVDRLIWLLTWRNVPGGADASWRPDQERTGVGFVYTCVGVVDATTGQVLVISEQRDDPTD